MNAIPIRVKCPKCGEHHVDRGTWARRPHGRHLCEHCGAEFVPRTVGVDHDPIGKAYDNGEKEGRRTMRHALLHALRQCGFHDAALAVSKEIPK